MPSRRWMWIRPTPHIYAYNREVSAFSSASGSASASSTSALAASSETSRYLRASSEAVADRSTSSRMTRAVSAAPEPGTSLSGYTGFYGRQMALLKETTEARKAEQAAASSRMAASSSASSSAVASSTAVASSASSSVSKSAVSMSTTVEKTVESKQSIIQRKQLEKKIVSFKAEMDRSLKEGRQSQSRAVRRAEYHAETSGKDPRHTYVPRDTSDDIQKKIADLHISPYEGREVGEARSAMYQGKLKVDRLEKELAAITTSAMKYQSFYLKSAHQMASEAIEASEAEAKSSKKVKKTVVTESRRQVAVA